MLVKTVNDLKIYEISLNLSAEINNLTKAVPVWWKVKEIDQILRSTDSIPSNISEGFSQRFYPKQFVKYLYIALGSGDETQTHLKILAQKKLIKQEISERYIREYKYLCVKIVNFISYLRKRHNIKGIKKPKSRATIAPQKPNHSPTIAPQKNADHYPTRQPRQSHRRK